MLFLYLPSLRGSDQNIRHNRNLRCILDVTRYSQTIVYTTIEGFVHPFKARYRPLFYMPSELGADDLPQYNSEVAEIVVLSRHANQAPTPGPMSNSGS